MIQFNEIEFMTVAIQEARRCVHEDGRHHPCVGVVVVREGKILASARRGDQAPGDHAEYTVLEKMLPREKLAGCTVDTTLEPCTTRNHPKIPCAERLIQRRIGRVVIGMLDPDQRITGNGILHLRRAGIEVDLFPPDLMAELEELNRDFIADRESVKTREIALGIAEAGITTFYPSRDYYSRLRSDAATIDRYVSKAKHNLVMVSVNLMTGIPFNDLCSCLKYKLSGTEDNFRVTISLLDWQRLELINVTALALGIEPDELATSIHRSLRNLISLRKDLPEPARLRFDIRVHHALPFGSAVMLDHGNEDGRIQIETKPFKVGLQKSFAFELKRTESDGLFDVMAQSYTTLLNEGRSLSEEDL